jgi:diaminopropionate ammonia-lyase
MTQPSHDTDADVKNIARDLRALSPGYSETPLISLPSLAGDLGVSAVYAKDESKRMLGSFKSLGGTYAALRALASVAGIEFSAISNYPGDLPDLITASAGNHGLAVAAAARFAGSKARIFLYPGVSDARRRRIADLGAEIVEVDGTYDDAVAAAKATAAKGAGILVADTSDDPNDPIVADVVAGYGVMCWEIRQATEANGFSLPTHLFVQAGVGGIAAALTYGLKDWMAAPARIVAVEPSAAACLSAALAAGSAVRVAGNLQTSATMLACGEASRPALQVLASTNVDVIALDEASLLDAPSKLRDAGGPPTTPSGAAGLAGLISIAADVSARKRHGLNSESRILIVITEGPLTE